MAGARRSLSHVGGAVDASGGDPAVQAALSRALEVAADEAATLAHVHGFHSYPARLHPETAARLIEAFSKSGSSILDPFCGSGTVLVEARRLGRLAVGVDANPLAIELAWLKTRGISPARAEQLVAAATAVAEHAEERRSRRAGPARKRLAADRELFDVHVLLELDGLQDGIRDIESHELRRVLGLVLSALLTKVSRRPGDTAERLEPRRFRSGHVIRSFVRKAEELARRLAEYQALLPPNAPRATARVGDARDLRLRPGSVDLIVTSPPYPGVYDYVRHHEARLRWLGLDTATFGRREIGSRRELSRLDADGALERWSADFSACLRQMAKVLRGSGNAALVIADSVLQDRPLYAEEAIARLARAAGLELVARASQVRPHFHRPTAHAFRNRPRREHVLLLRRRRAGAR